MKIKTDYLRDAKDRPRICLAIQGGKNSIKAYFLKPEKAKKIADEILSLLDKNEGLR